MNAPAQRLWLRRWFRFSLRTLLIVITLICVACGLWMRPILRKRSAVLHFYELTTQQQQQSPYEYEKPVTIGYEGDRSKPSVPDSLHWLRDLIGEECFGTVSGVQLNETQATDDDLRYLAAVPTVEQILLNGTQITDDGLLHLRACPNLRYLALNDTSVTDQGIAHLVQYQTLGSLSLNGTHITDEALEYLAQMPNLNSLWLRDTAISDAAYHKLQAALPDCKIQADVPLLTQAPRE